MKLHVHRYFLFIAIQLFFCFPSVFSCFNFWKEHQFFYYNRLWLDAILSYFFDRKVTVSGEFNI
jgi:hypothetical protein